MHGANRVVITVKHPTIDSKYTKFRFEAQPSLEDVQAKACQTFAADSVQMSYYDKQNRSMVIGNDDDFEDFLALGDVGVLIVDLETKSKKPNKSSKSKISNISTKSIKCTEFTHFSTSTVDGCKRCWDKLDSKQQKVIS